MGLDIWLVNDEAPNAAPEYYFRSNYNQYGTCIVLHDRIGKDYSWIFDNPRSHQRVKVNWRQTLERAEQVLAEFQSYLASMGPFDVLKFFPNRFSTPEELAMVDTLDKAADVFKEEKQRMEAEDNQPTIVSGHYYSGGGQYWWDGLELVSIVPGMSGAVTGCYGIVRRKEADFYQYIVNDLERVVVMCKMVLSKPESSFSLLWSG